MEPVSPELVHPATLDPGEQPVDPEIGRLDTVQR